MWMSHFALSCYCFLLLSNFPAATIFWSKWHLQLCLLHLRCFQMRTEKLTLNCFQWNAKCCVFSQALPLCCFLSALTRTLPGGQTGVLQHSLLPHQGGLCLYWGNLCFIQSTQEESYYHWEYTVYNIMSTIYTRSISSSLLQEIPFRDTIVVSLLQPWHVTVWSQQYCLVKHPAYC